MQVLADALERHWNKLVDDKLYREAVSKDPSKFRIRWENICLRFPKFSAQEVRGRSRSRAAFCGDSD